MDIYLKDPDSIKIKRLLKSLVSQKTWNIKYNIANKHLFSKYVTSVNVCNDLSFAIFFDSVASQIYKSAVCICNIQTYTKSLCHELKKPWNISNQRESFCKIKITQIQNDLQYSCPIFIFRNVYDFYSYKKKGTMQYLILNESLLCFYFFL